MFLGGHHCYHGKISYKLAVCLDGQETVGDTPVQLRAGIAAEVKHDR